MEFHVTKNGGHRELYNVEKINKVVTWASDGLDNVSPSEVILNAKLKFYEGIETDSIQESLIKSAAELITEYTSDYQYLAARLLMFKLRKQAYGKYTPTSFYSHIKKLTTKGIYDKEIIEKYSRAEINSLEKVINHEADLKLSYAAARQYQRKYLIKNKVTGIVYESPQYAIMLIGMCLFGDADDHLKKVKKFYNAVSCGKISLPTPIMGGVRTPTRQFSSCVLIDIDDNLDSINEATSAIVSYVSKRAGIGLNAGSIRAEGSPIRGGEAEHTGLIPFFKMFQAAVKSCSQGGIRGGAATINYPMWHYDFESLIVLKNNKGTEENRVRHVDYCVHVNGLLLERLIQGKEITFFSPDVADGELYRLFYSDQKAFKKLYEKLENDDTIRKKVKPALEIFVNSLVTERSSTGRIYLSAVDHMNTHGAFLPEVAPIRMTNLCTEIALPTKPLSKKELGEIALCTLSAFNVGEVEEDEYEELAELIVEALDNLLDYQDYPLEEARSSSQNRRTIGVGVTNYAYFLAKNGVKYSDGSANDLTFRLFENIQYYLLKASLKLAKEKGACEWFNETKYSKGILPIDTYKRDIDQHIGVELRHDWEELRSQILEHGLRNSTLTAIMPCETSSQITNSTNGIEPPRAKVSYKDSNDGVLKQAVPEIKNLDIEYELAWTIKDNTGYLILTGIMQIFVDQAISINTYNNPEHYENNKIPVKKILTDIINWYKYGNKSMYYHNTNDGSDEEEDACEGGACKL